MTPLVSVVIPTTLRPQFLARAVESAICGMDRGSVEVIVVPNGPDKSWRRSLRSFAGNSSVQVIPIPQRNANIARNTGLAHACGEFVRFLDDDDYLYPQAAAAQVRALVSSELDGISGSLDLVEADGSAYGRLNPVYPDDWPASVLGPRRLSIPAAHVFRRSMAQKVTWAPGLPWFQDVDWLFRMVRAFPELRWRGDSTAVGVWFQHPGVRTSPSLTTDVSQRVLCEWILATSNALAGVQQLTDVRRNAAARGLWHCAHRAFQFNPWFWTKIVAYARMLDATARPEILVFGKDLGRFGDPLVLEWLAAPPRLLAHGWRHARARLVGPPHRRTGR